MLKLSNNKKHLILYYCVNYVVNILLNFFSFFFYSLKNTSNTLQLIFNTVSGITYTWSLFWYDHYLKCDYDLFINKLIIFLISIN
jgi:hypothetical protein